MIGKWLTLCSDEALGDLLTEKLVPGLVAHVDGSRCLIGVIGNYSLTNCMFPQRSYPLAIGDDHCIGDQFDWLCARFTTERINAAIRERALKILAHRKEQQHATTPRSERVLAEVR